MKMQIRYGWWWGQWTTRGEKWSTTWAALMKYGWTRGYGEVTPVVCIDNPLTTNERLTSLPSVARNSPADTFITAPVLQFTTVSTSPPRGTNIIRLAEADKGNGWNNGWNNSICPPPLLFPPISSHDGTPHTPLIEALILTGQAAVQPSLENGNANPPGGVVWSSVVHPFLVSRPPGGRFSGWPSGPRTGQWPGGVLILRLLILFNFLSDTAFTFNIAEHSRMLVTFSFRGGVTLEIYTTKSFSYSYRT